MGSTSKENLLRDYPDLSNINLPLIIGCLPDNDKTEAKKGFQRVCFKDVRIVEVEGMSSNERPPCIWRIYYELKHVDEELAALQSDKNSDIVAPDLPDNEQSLKKLFEQITVVAACYMGMKVERKYIGQNKHTAVVEYSPKGCQCANKDFEMATEDPRRWPNITEEMEVVQNTLLQMKILEQNHINPF